MPEIINEKKLSTFRKFYLEASVLALAVCLYFTVKFVVSLYDKMIDYATKDGRDSTEQLKKSNEVIQRNSQVIENLQNLIIQQNQPTKNELITTKK